MEGLDRSDFERFRRGYSYVPARLVYAQAGQNPEIVYGNIGICTDVPEKWPDSATAQASVSLDKYHQELLTSSRDEDVLVGLTSVCFWGFSSGSDGRVNASRALSKVREVLFGRGNSSPDSKEKICDAVRLSALKADQGAMGEALAAILALKMFGVSFASKVIAFLNPGEAGVYDSVIADGLLHSGSSLYFSPRFTSARSTRVSQHLAFQRWCAACSAQAQRLRDDGSLWHDWNGSSQGWRAVDVERALFASLGRKKRAP